MRVTRGFPRAFAILILVILAGGLFWYLHKNELVGTTTYGPLSNENSQQGTSNMHVNTDAPITFRDTVYKLRPGDRAGSMSVISVEPFRPDYSELGPDNVVVKFSGTAVVEGTYQYYHSNFDGGWDLYFKLASNTPDLPFKSPEFPFFRFTNQEEAEHLFGISPKVPKEGAARIRIQGYTLINYPSEVADSTTIVSVQ